MIELSFAIEPDANGVVDGRDLARGLIQSAYQLLVPYIGGCPACADALFTAVTNDVIAELHAFPSLPGKIMNVTPDPDGAHWREHQAATKAFTDHLLNNTSRRSSPHIH